MSDEIRRLAEEAFLKQERLMALMHQNTPIDFEQRKKAFVELEVARAANNEARAALDAATGGRDKLPMHYPAGLSAFGINWLPW